MSDLICRKTMMRCQTPGMCAPYGGCRDEAAIPADQVLVPRRLLEDIEMTWRIWDRHAKPFNELGERKIREGLEELRSLLKHTAKA
ncbi:hypothetical protein IB274_02625 [Pseudomonas sp. PDM18]|uniref:hypothetical protein n=1 Tax=Pseudomonas sp. PDM18 TaxID=2769253 RepID=UPI001783063F|nr:hypothetical protein [Pseudomonas sp. PDM18]MBD9675574.1 hypothetical protein [Pseudomonas sp. PDM18]